ncbi:restriction endonuclease PLD domain-containing protein [Komagataeibacter rhaeticus]
MNQRFFDPSTLRFRLLTGRPSHEKLYLLSGPDGHRVVTGSANLSLSAFHARQHEVIITFDDPTAWHVFEDYYQRDYKQSVPVEDEILIGVSPDCENGAGGYPGGPAPL